eukprot:316130_1
MRNDKKLKLDDRNWYDRMLKALLHKPTLIALGFVVDLSELWKHIDMVLECKNTDVTAINTASDIFVTGINGLVSKIGIYEQIINSLIIDNGNSDKDKRYKLWYFN